MPKTNGKTRATTGKMDWGATIGDIVRQVVLATQPPLIKVVTSAVTTATRPLMTEMACETEVRVGRFEEGGPAPDIRVGPPWAVQPSWVHQDMRHWRDGRRGHRKPGTGAGDGHWRYIEAGRHQAAHDRSSWSLCGGIQRRRWWRARGSYVTPTGKVSTLTMTSLLCVRRWRGFYMNDPSTHSVDASITSTWRCPQLLRSTGYRCLSDCTTTVRPSNALLPDLEKNEENEQPLALAAQCCEIYHLLITRHVLYLFCWDLPATVNLRNRLRGIFYQDACSILDTSNLKLILRCCYITIIWWADHIPGQVCAQCQVFGGADNSWPTCKFMRFVMKALHDSHLSVKCWQWTSQVGTVVLTLWVRPWSQCINN